jgi:heme-degrading monooxygenase HmoA
MTVPFTHGIWQVQPGRADDFIAAWTEFADWTLQNAAGAGWGKLLRDREDPNRFFTFGPWESFDAIAAWRQLPGWQERVGQIRAMLESFQPATLEVVVERG